MRKALIAMMVYLVIFAVLIIISFSSYLHANTLVDIGLPVKKTNLIILVFSIVGFMKSFWHIIRMKV